VDPERFREALARWASTVTVVAVRDADTGAVHATTVSSFAPVAADPPQVLVALGPGAQVLPFVDVGDAIGVSVLAESQSRWATVFADAFPVGSAPWQPDGAPVVPGAAAALACTVRQVHRTDGESRVVICRVEDVTLGDEERPLLYWRRTYARLED
jgi:flavin reductase (DIM6/NTAB) family NADH-FMN oxidoreductase RutF